MIFKAAYSLMFYYWPNVSAIWRKTSPNNLRLFPSLLFLYLLNQRMPIYHREGQLRIFYLAHSVPGPNSAFLWKTAVILIDEIQRCPKQSGGSPTVAHRRGAPVLLLFLRKKRARPENTRGKENHDFQFKRARKAAFLYRQWESAGKPFFHLQTKTILGWLFPSWCIQL